MARMLALLLLSSLMLACGPLEPYTYDQVKSKDDLEVSAADAPSDAEIAEEPADVLILPTQSPPELAEEAKVTHALVSPMISRALGRHGHLHARFESVELKKDSAPLTIESACEIADAAEMPYVAWFRVISFDPESQVHARDAMAELRYEFQLVDARTRSIVASIKSEGYSEGRTYTAEQPSTAKLIAECVREIEGEIAKEITAKFPPMGYVVQLRGERSIAKIIMPGHRRLPIGTRLNLLKRHKEIEPREKKAIYRYEVIGELEVELVNEDGIWCDIIEGEKVIRLGHGLRFKD